MGKLTRITSLIQTTTALPREGKPARINSQVRSNQFIVHDKCHFTLDEDWGKMKPTEPRRQNVSSPGSRRGMQSDTLTSSFDSSGFSAVGDAVLLRPSRPLRYLYISVV